MAMLILVNTRINHRGINRQKRADLAVDTIEIGVLLLYGYTRHHNNNKQGKRVTL